MNLAIVKDEKGDLEIVDDSGLLSVGTIAIVPNNYNMYGSGGIENAAIAVCKGLQQFYGSGTIRTAEIEIRRANLDDNPLFKCPFLKTVRWIVGEARKPKPFLSTKP